MDQIMFMVGVFVFALNLMQAQESVNVVESTPVSFDWSAQPSLKTLQPEYARGKLFVQHMDGPSDTTYSVYTRDGRLVGRFKVDLPDVQQMIGGRIAPLVSTDGYVAIAIAIHGSEGVATLRFLDRSGKSVKDSQNQSFLAVSDNRGGRWNNLGLWCYGFR